MKSGKMQPCDLHRLLTTRTFKIRNITMKNNFLKALSLIVPLLFSVSALPKAFSLPGVHKETLIYCKFAQVLVLDCLPQ